jgi:sugar/nucleoside kinase (ribokinase family)
MVDLVTFGIIIDDLVFPGGRAAMGMLGGGGPQTAFGMRLPTLAGWTEQSRNVGLVAGIGHDYSDSARAWLKSAGIDLAGVHERDLPTPRAWQVLEADGRRTQVWRVEGEVVGIQLGRSLDHIPASYRTAMGFHLGIHPNEPDLDFIRQLRNLPPSRPPPAARGEVDGKPIISIELFKPADRPLADTALRQLCNAADIFSSNVAEAQSLVGNGSPEELVHRLTDAGARIVVLRMGQDGSLVYARDQGTPAHVPAVQTTVVDPTGAGNAYCGGFLAGYVQTGDILSAGRFGSVAASFLVEQVGLPVINDQMRIEANRRLNTLSK